MSYKTFYKQSMITYGNKLKAFVALTLQIEDIHTNTRYYRCCVMYTVSMFVSLLHSSKQLVNVS